VSDLSFIERSKLEKLFGMDGGYVLNFSNRTFQEFVADSVRRDIYCGKYDYSGCSKASLLRRLWEIEPNHGAQGTGFVSLCPAHRPLTSDVLCIA